MANLNKVMLMGNLTRDLELKYLPNQTAVCDFGLAINRNWTGADGVKKEEVTFVDCTCFGKTAEILVKYKKKGDPLFVEGRLKLDQWEHEGQKRSKLKVVVENFQFLNRGTGGGFGGGDQGAAGGGEYSGEPGQAGGYAARQPAARPAYNRAPRPAAGPAGGQGAPQQSGPDYDAGDTIPEDTTPPIRDEEIPF